MILLPCVCGASGRTNPQGLIFCTAGHTDCEREDFTPKEWNTATIKYYKQRALLLRNAAKKMILEAKQMEKIINVSKGDAS